MSIIIIFFLVYFFSPFLFASLVWISSASVFSLGLFFSFSFSFFFLYFVIATFSLTLVTNTYHRMSSIYARMMATCEVLRGIHDFFCLLVTSRHVMFLSLFFCHTCIPSCFFAIFLLNGGKNVLLPFFNGIFF